MEEMFLLGRTYGGKMIQNQVFAIFKAIVITYIVFIYVVNKSELKLSQCSHIITKLSQTKVKYMNFYTNGNKYRKMSYTCK